MQVPGSAFDAAVEKAKDIKATIEKISEQIEFLEQSLKEERQAQSHYQEELQALCTWLNWLVDEEEDYFAILGVERRKENLNDASKDNNN